MAIALEKLLSTEEVADILGCHPRKVRDLPIPFIRIGRLKRYHPKHLRNYMQESLECQSVSARAPRTTTTTSSSKVVGLREALKQRPVVKLSV